jgi:hypothetical protein
LAGSLRIADGLVMCWCFSGGWSIWSHQSDEHLPLIISWFHMSWKLTTLLLLHVSLDPSDQRALESSLRWSSILGIPRVKRPGQSVWPGATWIVLLSPSLRFSLLQHVVKTSMWLQFSLRFPWKLHRETRDTLCKLRVALTVIQCPFATEKSSGLDSCSGWARLSPIWLCFENGLQLHPKFAIWKQGKWSWTISGFEVYPIFRQGNSLG